MAWFENIKSEFYRNLIQANRWMRLVEGLRTTLLLTAIAFLIGLVLGIVIAIVRSTYDKTADTVRPSFGRTVFGFFNGVCKVYLTILRGTPVVVQLMIIYFVIFVSAKDGTMVAALAFGLNSAAYMAEIIRGGIMSIDNGQFEAGRSLGFNYIQTMRFIVIPQTVKNVLPAMANEFISLLKETSIAGYVGVQDLTYKATQIRSQTFSAFMPLIAEAIIYLTLVMFFTWLVSLLERSLKKNER